jgi:hypothetical protein
MSSAMSSDDEYETPELEINISIIDKSPNTPMSSPPPKSIVRGTASAPTPKKLIFDEKVVIHQTETYYQRGTSSLWSPQYWMRNKVVCVLVSFIPAILFIFEIIVIGLEFHHQCALPLHILFTGNCVVNAVMFVFLVFHFAYRLFFDKARTKGPSPKLQSSATQRKSLHPRVARPHPNDLELQEKMGLNSLEDSQKEGSKEDLKPQPTRVKRSDSIIVQKSHAAVNLPFGRSSYLYRSFLFILGCGLS